MAAKRDFEPGQRIEVFWHRGDEGLCYQGTGLPGGRVQFDVSFPFVSEGTFILEHEEIADWRPLKT